MAIQSSKRRALPCAPAKNIYDTLYNAYLADGAIYGDTQDGMLRWMEECNQIARLRKRGGLHRTTAGAGEGFQEDGGGEEHPMTITPEDFLNIRRMAVGVVEDVVEMIRNATEGIPMRPRLTRSGITTLPKGRRHRASRYR